MEDKKTSRDSTLSNLQENLNREVEKSYNYTTNVYTKEIAIINDRQYYLNELRENNNKFNEKDYLDCINYNRLSCLKIIFEPNKDYNDSLMNRAIQVGNLNIVKYLLNEHNISINKKNIIICALSEFYDLLIFILKNTNIYPIIESGFGKILDFKSMNLLINYEIKSFILLNNPTNLVISDFIKKFLKIFNKIFIPDMEILKEVWDKVKFSIIRSLFIHNKIFLVSLLMIENKLDDYLVKSLLDCLLYSHLDSKYELIWLINNKGHNVIKRLELINYVIDVIEDTFLELFLNKKLCLNSSMCNDCINKTNFNLETWSEVFSLNNNLVVYKSNDNYCFNIPDLLKCWEEDLNGYNYKITPSFPRNPYNRKYFNPIEMYIIIVYCAINKIKIPFIVSFFIKQPTMITFIYNKFINSKNEDDIENSYDDLKYNLLDLCLKYEGGNSENNEAGNWVIDKSLMDISLINYCSDNYIKVELSYLLLCKIDILVKGYKFKKKTTI